MTIPEFQAVREAFRRLIDQTNSTPETCQDGDHLFRPATGQWWLLDGLEWRPCPPPMRKSSQPPTEPSP